MADNNLRLDLLALKHKIELDKWEAKPIIPRQTPTKQIQGKTIGYYIHLACTHPLYRKHTRALISLKERQRNEQLVMVTNELSKLDSDSQTETLFAEKWKFLELKQERERYLFYLKWSRKLASIDGSVGVPLEFYKLKKKQVEELLQAAEPRQGMQMEKKQSAAPDPVPLPQEPTKSRKAQVDEYIEEVYSKTRKRMTRSDFWKTAHYKTATDFQRWQRNDPKSAKVANERFAAILNEKPHLK